jgi:hypothetical protein
MSKSVIARALNLSGPLSEFELDQGVRYRVEYPILRRRT